eukprot:1136949-Pelagomonas_calceolata.AAC.8
MIEVEEASNYSFGDTVPWGSLSGASPSLMRILRGVEASLGQPSIPEYMVKSHQWVTIARLGAAASTYQGMYTLRLPKWPEPDPIQASLSAFVIVSYQKTSTIVVFGAKNDLWLGCCRQNFLPRVIRQEMDVCIKTNLKVCSAGFLSKSSRNRSRTETSHYTNKLLLSLANYTQSSRSVQKANDKLQEEEGRRPKGQHKHEQDVFNLFESSSLLASQQFASFPLML